MKENSAGKSFFIVAALVAVIALILSISRLFLSSSDRTGIEGFFTYDLTVSSQMIAFLSIIIISIPLIMVGSFLKKEYDIVGIPLMLGGLLVMIFETVVVFANFYLGSHGQADTMPAELVLTFVLAVEWLMLVIYLWQSEDKLMTAPPSSAPPSETTPTQQPPATTPPPSIPPPPDLNSMLPPSVVNK